MTIEFNHVVPVPLQGYPHAAESVWMNKFTLDFPSTIFLNAHSGKGKTTFAGIVYGVRHDYTGDVLFDGKNIRSFSLHDWISLRQNKLSVIFQDLQLFGDLTALENLLLKNTLTNHFTQNKIESMMEKLGLGDKKNQTCRTLSLGQQQRVAIIRALLQPFDLLIMDEPFSHLDDKNTQHALQLILEVTNENKGGLLMTTLGNKYGIEPDLELIL
ncbi:MAG: ATP-binding cassette domain-containing protein [Crocinitomicaceae bacterium]|nr:ATP-binding cassette domain-containing protein [Crocinitomicaceae bacterium]MBK8924430.1 ATP-binding cassette domain-containing protein [Crocinitomicaceae bacterium]